MLEVLVNRQYLYLVDRYFPRRRRKGTPIQLATSSGTAIFSFNRKNRSFQFSRVGWVNWF